jgi:hypothetical protein
MFFRWFSALMWTGWRPRGVPECGPGVFPGAAKQWRSLPSKAWRALPDLGPAEFADRVGEGAEAYPDGGVAPGKRRRPHTAGAEHRRHRASGQPPAHRGSVSRIPGRNDVMDVDITFRVDGAPAEVPPRPP